MQLFSWMSKKLLHEFEKSGKEKFHNWRIYKYSSMKSKKYY